MSGLRDGYGAVGEQAPGLRLAETAVLDEQPVVEEDALLVDGAAARGHGAGGDAADLGVVAARGDVEQDPLTLRVEDRGDDGDVGEMGAAVVRVVDGVRVTRPHAGAAPADDLLDAGAHRSQVDGDVRGVGDEVAVRVEERAGEVEAFLDVDGLGGGLQSGAHLFGDRHEEVVEDFEEYGVGRRAGVGTLRDRRTFHDQVSVVRSRPLPAVVHDRRGPGLGDDRGSGDGLAGRAVGRAGAGAPRARCRRCGG